MDTFTCKRCSNNFDRPLKDVNRGRTKFCSRVCSDAYKKEASAAYVSQVARTGKKQCKQCSKTLRVDNFPPSTTSRTGYNSYCRPCTRIKMRAADAKRADKRKVWSRQRYLMRTYKLTTDDYDALVKQQNGGCLICASTDRLNVDHCHKTGRVRGILCEKCNRGLGLFMDNPQSLTNAAKYVSP